MLQIHIYLHVSIHSCEFVHFSLFSSSSFLDGVIIVVKLVIRNGTKVRTWTIRPVIRTTREAWRMTRAWHKHGGVGAGTAHAGGVQVAWN